MDFDREVIEAIIVIIEDNIDALIVKMKEVSYE